MIITLMNSLAVLLPLALLFAFTWGAGRHTVEQALGDPLSADPTHVTKTKRYITLVGKVLWNVVMLVIMVGRILLEFMLLSKAWPVVIYDRRRER